MAEDASWDLRYLAQAYPTDTEPAAVLQELLPLLPRGWALDLAAGSGRNAVFLAAKGWRVVAMDRSSVGLEKAEVLARERGIPVAWLAARSLEALPEQSNLLLVEADLEHVPLPIDRFPLILCIQYLQRSLFSSIADALRRGGMLLYETFTTDQLAWPKGPRDPAHLLRPGELRTSFPHLNPVFYREFTAGKGIATLLARKP